MDEGREEKQCIEKMKIMKRVWDSNGVYIGDFEVPVEYPALVFYNGKLYEYSESWSVYCEMKDQPYNLNTLWTTNIKRQ